MIRKNQQILIFWDRGNPTKKTYRRALPEGCSEHWLVWFRN